MSSASSALSLPSPLTPGDIEIKPPIDLIPDEYDRRGNDKIYVEVFCNDDDREAHELIEVLQKLQFLITKTDPERQNCDREWIKRVQNNINNNDYDGIIFLIAKVYLRAEEMKDIWSQFTTKNCPKLKNKPKIFIFQIGRRPVARDRTATELNWLSAYETPSEADMLIIHDRYDEGRTDLLGQLCTSIEEYGERENIITLISLSYEHNYQPLLISTMTKNFYFKYNIYRGQHLDILTRQESSKKKIEKMRLQLAEEPKEPKSKKKERSFVRAWKHTFSFKKKNVERKDTSEEVANSDSHKHYSTIDLLKALTENIQDCGARENIINLISVGSTFCHQPLIISTMTKNFFFVNKPYRGHGLSLMEKQNRTKKEIKKLIRQRSQLANISSKSVYVGSTTASTSSATNLTVRKRISNNDSGFGKQQFLQPPWKL